MRKGEGGSEGETGGEGNREITERDMKGKGSKLGRENEALYNREAMQELGGWFISLELKSRCSTCTMITIGA